MEGNMSGKYNVIVVGAGPAGLMASWKDVLFIGDAPAYGETLVAGAI